MSPPNRENINANRVLTGGSDPGELNHSRIELANQSAGTAPTIYRAVVEEVIYDPRRLTPQDKDRIRASVANATAVEQIAANSVIAIMVSEGVSNAIQTRLLLAPFFQSHLMLPVQAGEQVSVVFDDFQKFGFLGGRWITRQPDGYQVEDSNFTHGDRRFTLDASSDIARTSERGSNSSQRVIPGFPNGGDTLATRTLPANGNENPYNAIYAASSASLMHSYEAVPRWTKRPQELVLQGMNNSLIVLGQDRSGPASGSLTDEYRYAGAVDVVVGRSRFLPEPWYDAVTDQIATAPLTAINSRGLVETDKSPASNRRRERLREGDPDFARDAGRLYLSMKTKGDENFGINKTTRGSAAQAMLPGFGTNYSPLAISPAAATVSSSENVGSSYAALKADHVRVIARRSVPGDMGPVISGSIMLIKEGTVRTPHNPLAQAGPGDHQAFFYMSPEGRVQLDGLQIFFGGAALREEGNNPAPDLPGDATGSDADSLSVGSDNRFAGVEPWIRWSEFKKVVEGLQRQINDLHDAYSGLVDDIEAASVGSSCTPFGPDTAWQPLATSSRLKRTTLDRAIRQHRSNTNSAVYRSRSAKLFGQ